MFPPLLTNSIRHSPGFGIVSKVMESQSGESCFLSQAVPGGVPILLMLQRIITALAFVLAVRDSGKVLRHQVVLWLAGGRLQESGPENEARCRFRCFAVQFNDSRSRIG